MVLPAPLGPMRPQSSSFVDGEVDGVDGREAAEADRDFVELEQRGH